jgi:FkbM family methyltransferase
MGRGMDEMGRLARDCLVLGPGTALFMLAKLLKRQTVVVPLRGVGRVKVRPADTDFYMFRQVFSARHYDLGRFEQGARLQRVYRQQLAAGKRPVIIDAGANVGAATHWFARLFPESAIFAVEPDKSNASLCQKNVANLGNVTVVEGAIGGQPGIVSVQALHEACSSRTHRIEGGDGIPIYTVSDLVTMAGANSSLFIVKVDIEGFEADLFRSGTEWIESAAAIFVEPHDWLLPGQKTSQPMQAALLGAGFEILALGENLAFVREKFDSQPTPARL